MGCIFESSVRPAAVLIFPASVTGVVVVCLRFLGHPIPLASEVLRRRQGSFVRSSGDNIFFTRGQGESFFVLYSRYRRVNVSLGSNALRFRVINDRRVRVFLYRLNSKVISRVLYLRKGSTRGLSNPFIFSRGLRSVVYSFRFCKRLSIAFLGFFFASPKETMVYRDDDFGGGILFITSEDCDFVRVPYDRGERRVCGRKEFG